MDMWLIQILLFSGVGSVYINRVSVRVPGGYDVVEAIAAKHDCRVIGSIGSLPDYYVLEHSKMPKYHSKPSTRHLARLANEDAVKYVKQEILLQRYKRVKKNLNTMFNDPWMDKMWFVNGPFNLNVQAAWRAGLSGRGVVVTVVDDGIERNHSDLVANFDPLASYDYNDYDNDPMLRYDELDDNKHGTLCAGVVSAAANNFVCAVGVAFNANLGAIRLLDGNISDYMEASSLSHKIQHIDIYSNSWGPSDDGYLVGGPKDLTQKALQYGATIGRAGKGCIYVWASGNGGHNDDTCSVDGYVNSIYTIGIAAVTSTGESPFYAEKCSAILAATFSSGYSDVNEFVVSSDIRNSCSEIFSGTSAATPMAAGVIALVLEANKDLTWRDIQYITLMSARSDQLPDGQWDVNGAGRRFSHRYGFGIMDAFSMIRLARGWISVPKQDNISLLAYPQKEINGYIAGRTMHTEQLDTSNVLRAATGRFVEHVELKIKVRFYPRGSLGINVTSPMKTRSTFLFSRPRDYTNDNYDEWPFMSVHFWGEGALGVWTVELINQLTSQDNWGYLTSIELIIYVTNKYPVTNQDVSSNTESTTVDYSESDVSESGPISTSEPESVSTDSEFKTELQLGTVTPKQDDVEVVVAGDMTVYIVIACLIGAVVLTVMVVVTRKKLAKLMKDKMMPQLAPSRF